MKVLLVEDNADMRVLVKDILADIGISQVIEADNGSDAYHKALLQKFDFVISDVKMPVMDGLGLLEVLRTIRGFSKVPYLLMSADDVRFNDYVIKDNSYSFIPKPVNTLDLVRGVKDAAKLDVDVARQLHFLWSRAVFHKLVAKTYELLRSSMTGALINMSAEKYVVSPHKLNGGLLISLEHALGKSLLMLGWSSDFYKSATEIMPEELLLNLIKQDLLESWHKSLGNLGESFEYQIAMLNPSQIKMVLQTGQKAVVQDFTSDQGDVGLFLLKY